MFTTTHLITLMDLKTCHGTSLIIVAIPTKLTSFNTLISYLLMDAQYKQCNTYVAMKTLLTTCLVQQTLHPYVAIATYLVLTLSRVHNLSFYIMSSW